MTEMMDSGNKPYGRIAAPSIVIPAQAGIHLCGVHDGFPLSRE